MSMLKNAKAKKVISPVLKGYSFFLKQGINALNDFVQYIDYLRVGQLEFSPRDDDIFIVTYPRSGTTLMQMIMYQLTTNGSMDIPHICQVAPWFERSISYNIMDEKDLENLQSPRIFKTHLAYKDIPKGNCRYICVIRNGMDVAVSFFHFYRSHLGYTGTFPEFFSRFMKGKVQFDSWFDHVSEWIKNKDALNVMLLRYEDLIADFETGIRKIIDFCDIEISEERIPEVLEKCSFAYMKKHESKFDHVTSMIWEKGYKNDSFIRQGKIGSGKEFFNFDMEKAFKKKFDKYIGSLDNI